MTLLFFVEEESAASGRRTTIAGAFGSSIIGSSKESSVVAYDCGVSITCWMMKTPTAKTNRVTPVSAQATLAASERYLRSGRSLIGVDGLVLSVMRSLFAGYRYRVKNGTNHLRQHARQHVTWHFDFLDLLALLVR